MEKFTIQNGHLTIVTSNNNKCDETISIWLKVYLIKIIM